MTTCAKRRVPTALLTCIRDLDSTGKHVGWHDNGHGTRWFDEADTPAVPDVGARFLVQVNGEPVNPDAPATAQVAMNVWLGALGEQPDATVEIVAFDHDVVSLDELAGGPAARPPQRPRPARRRANLTVPPELGAAAQ